MTLPRRAGWLLLFMVAAVACCSAATATPTPQDGRLSPSAQPVASAAASWTGTIESDTQNATALSDGHSYLCTDHWHTDFSFTLQPGGSITGTGKGTLVSGPSCSGDFDTAGMSTFPPAKEVDLSVAGSKQAGAFTLTFGYVSSNGVLYGGFSSLFTQQSISPGAALTVPITAPCAAGGTVPTSDSLETGLVNLTASNVFALKCGPCDTTLIGKSAGEFTRSDILLGESDTKAYKSQGEYEEWIADEEKEFVGISFEKPTLLEIIKGTAKDAGYEAIGDKLVHVFEVDIGPILTAYWIASDIEPHILDHDADMKEAQKLSDDGVREGKQAVADLNAELEQEPNCQEQAKAQRAKEDLADKKRALVNQWEINKDNQYWNPTRQEWEAEGLALKSAEEILTGARKLQAADNTSAVPTRKVRVTVAQAGAALVYINKALKLHTDALTRERKTLTRTAAFVKAMRSLLKKG